MNRTDRLLGILLELEARRSVRAEDLARQFEVSVRTIYRDIEGLCETGVPVAATPGKGYHLLPGYFLPPLSFTATEAALLALGGNFVRDHLDTELRMPAAAALQKLTAVLSEEKRTAVERWLQELRFPNFTVRSAAQSRLPQLRRAVQSRRVVRLRYHAREYQHAEQREVEPVSLFYADGSWHLAGWCRLRRAQRIFRLDRIEACDVIDEQFSLDGRHRFEPRDRDKEKAGLPEARVRFTPEVLRFVRERQPYLFLREELDERGPVMIYAVRSERQMLSWLLGWGSAVEIDGPPELRERFADEAALMLTRHLATTKEIRRPPNAADSTVSVAPA